MPTPEPRYSLDDSGRFTIDDYNWARPFSNFFPGIAGKWGIPMWMFYVSRAQGLCSIGVHDKDHAIMEFLSFNKALQVVGQQGFRSFLRIDGGEVYEPFQKQLDADIQQRMTVSSHELEIGDHNRELAIETTVTYFPLTNLPLAGLVRQVRIRNSGTHDLHLELIDGLPKILPYGVSFEHTKVIARHIEGMMGVFEVEGVPLFRLKQTPGDVEQVGEISGGNFYLSLAEDGSSLGGQTIVDPYLVFAEQEAHDRPWGFMRSPVDDLLATHQVRENRTPSALTAVDRSIPAGQTFSLTSIVGFAPNDSALASLAGQVSDPEFLIRQRAENERVIQQIKDTAYTLSGQPAFDHYVGQTFLDNVMRGGMPVVFESGEQKSVFYIYARQNGDLERDYHWFVLEPTYLSQGNGHYRSILQNRRMDGWFFPEIQDFNLQTYLNLIQTDGYNPLVVNGFSYSVEDAAAAEQWIRSNVPRKGVKQMSELIRGSFTPGGFIGALEQLGEPIARPYEQLLAELLTFCRTNEIGALHEGYWQDHWFYNLDTIDTFRMVYPDRWLEALLEQPIYTFFDNPDVVQPRESKTVLVGNRVRQYGAVLRDAEKQALIAARERDGHLLRTQHGQGQIYLCNLLAKLLCIIANRIASLDRDGRGIEMEAGKPGWLDSLNGLPALFGSSLNETLELERACRMLLESLSGIDLGGQLVYRELAELIHSLNGAMAERLLSADALAYWERSQELKEHYREATRLGIDGDEVELTKGQIIEFLENCLAVIGAGLESEGPQAEAEVPHTYFITEIVKYEVSKSDASAAGEDTVPVTPLQHNHRSMASFLEGPVHVLRVRPQQAKAVYEAVRRSELFDRELQMYRCCSWLVDEPLEIGRIKSYARGWIENESIYTHMEYKWLLEVLRSGLHREFFDDMEKALVPFMDPSVYGRSTLENCSFIASSVFPDPHSHGRAFQPRLSGVTCEMLNIWALMVAGPMPFFLDGNGELGLRLQPILHARFFTTEPTTARYWNQTGKYQTVQIPEQSFAFKFLGQALVVYSNPKRKSTFGEEGVGPVRYALMSTDGDAVNVEGSILDRGLAEQVRSGAFSRIDVRLG